MSDAQKTEPPATPFLFNGQPLQTADDVASFFGTSAWALRYTLYRAPESSRYTAFEIPKRSGGMRQIHAPVGLVRELQEKLAPILSAHYQAHPSAHGFITARGVLSNAKAHVGQNLVLNVDLEDFFPSINFGRVRGLFMSPRFGMGPAAAAVMAQLCIHRNGLPQGAPTSPALSNFIAETLDRRLTRLAKENRLTYTRYADDITFSSNQPSLPVSIAQFELEGEKTRIRVGEALERAIHAAGFSVNHKKVRLHRRYMRQAVTGLTVNTRVNIGRDRIRLLRAMLHAWGKFGLEAAASEHFANYAGGAAGRNGPPNPVRSFRNVVYGHLSFVKMVRGADDPVFLKLCARLIDLDPNPSKFVRQMVFGAGDYDVFVSHASEDKAEIARPIYEACAKLGLKVFLDEEHIGWGESFTKKINTALGAARVVVAVISSNSVSKEWPVLEVNAALALEVSGQKTVVPVIVGKPDLNRLPLISAKDCLYWKGDPQLVAAKLKELKDARGQHRAARAPLQSAPGQSAPGRAAPVTRGGSSVPPVPEAA
jgi:RNA-directed DNA polymerase